MRNPKLDIDIDQPSDESVLITLTGDLDAMTAPELRDEVTTLLFTHHPHELIIDFAGVDFLDSGGIRVLIDIHRRQRDQERKLILTNVPAAPQRVLEVTGLTGTLDLR
jgi:anti-anti-sigma factor